MIIEPSIESMFIARLHSSTNLYKSTAYDFCPLLAEDFLLEIFTSNIVWCLLEPPFPVDAKIQIDQMHVYAQYL